MIPLLHPSGWANRHCERTTRKGSRGKCAGRLRLQSRSAHHKGEIMQVQARHTIVAQRMLRAPDKNQPRDRGEFERRDFAPGETFDTADWGITDDEAKAMLADGAVAGTDAPAQIQPQAGSVRPSDKVKINGR
jgi:hypothetical protein